MAKIIKVSDDAGANYYTLPGGQGDIAREMNPIDDTLFGQTFKSQFPGMISWNISANAIYKGFAGYVADIKKQGTSTAMTGEAMTLVSGKRYKITATTKNIWDRTATWVVYDGVTDVTAQVETWNYLFGQIVFKSSYTVVGAVTVDGKYYPTAVLGQGQSFSLTQTAEAIQTTTFALAQANGGYHTHSPGLRTVGLEVRNIYALASGFASALQARSEWIVELNPDGADKSRARGFFQLTRHGQSGNVGALEEETVQFSLNVPYVTGLEYPFSWDHAADTTIPTGLKKCLDAWNAETGLKVRYSPDGTAGDEGNVVVTECSLTGGLEAMNDFKVGFRGNGALAAY